MPPLRPRQRLWWAAATLVAASAAAATSKPMRNHGGRRPAFFSALARGVWLALIVECGRGREPVLWGWSDRADSMQVHSSQQASAAQRSPTHQPLPTPGLLFRREHLDCALIA